MDATGRNLDILDDFQTNQRARSCQMAQTARTAQATQSPRPHQAPGAAPADSEHSGNDASTAPTHTPASPAFTNDVPDHTDVAIIGSGPGGYSCALRAAQLGLHVTLIERDAHAGGTCLNRGCIPTKALLDAAHARWDALRGEALGFGTKAAAPDRMRLLDFQHEAVRTMVDGLESLITARRITFVHGLGAVEAPAGTSEPSRTVTVTAENGAMHRIIARHVVIATGASPRPLAEAPFGGRVLDSDAALELPVIPRSVIVVGSGAVGLEFASFWAAMGSDVTVLLRHGRPLSDWPRRVGASLKRGMAAHGVTFVDYTAVESVESNRPTEPHDSGNGSVTVTVATRKGSAALSADYCLVAIGRTPATDAAWIEEAGVTRDQHGFIITDAYGRTQAHGIWALGDVTAGRQLAHRAFAQGRVVAECMAGLSPEPVCDNLVPRVVFSLPEAASVGLDADQAKSSEFGNFTDVKESAVSMTGNARTTIAGETGIIDVVTGIPAQGPDAASRQVLGVHMAGPHVSEFVGEAQQIVRNQIPLAEAAQAVHAHPTFSEALGEALLKADGTPLHTL